MSRKLLIKPKIFSPLFLKKYWGDLLIPLLLIISLVPCNANDSVSSLQKNITQTNEIIKAHEKDLNQIAQERKRCEQKIKRLNNNLSITNKKIETLNLQRQEIIEEKQIIEEKLKQERIHLQIILQHAYMLGRNPGTKILLNNEDPSTNSRYMVYYSYLMKSRTEALAKINEIQQELNNKKHLFDEKSKALSSLQQDYNESYAALEREKQRKIKNEFELKDSISSEKLKIQKMQIALDSLQKDIEQKQKQIREQRRIKHSREIAQVRRQAQIDGKNQDIAEAEIKHTQHKNTPNGIGNNKGRLPWPVKGSIIRNFGQTRNGDITWKGLLISANKGQKVTAVASGDILYSGWLNGFGNIIVIDHGKGYITLYGNNDSIIAKTGEQVKTGETIAFAGNTGELKTNSLYFEIRYQGAPLNPNKWLSHQNR